MTTEEARQWAKENDVSVCVESSAKSGDGVEDAFQKVAEEVFRKIRDGVFDLTDKVRALTSSHSLLPIHIHYLRFVLLTSVNWDQSQPTKEFSNVKSRNKRTEETRRLLFLMGLRTTEIPDEGID